MTCKVAAPAACARPATKSASGAGPSFVRVNIRRLPPRGKCIHHFKRDRPLGSQLDEPRCEMERPMKEVPCSFCGGTGKDPFGIMSHLSTCCVCGGTGVVQVGAPYVRCAHCRGTGAIKTLTCTVCGGKGLVPSPVGPTATCSECQGTGDDASAPAMACLRCRGRGRVPVSRVKTDVK